MINVIINNKDKTAVVEFPMDLYKLYQDLHEIGFQGGPHRVKLTDNEEDDIRVKLFSDNDFGNHLVLLFNENDTLEDVHTVVGAITIAPDEVKEQLEEYILHDQLDTKEELYDLLTELKETNAPIVTTFYCPLTGQIAKLYDLWYEQAEEIRRTYTSEMPKRIPLVDNKEFTSVKNAVINEALNLLAGHYEVEDLPSDEIETEPTTTDYESTDPPHEPSEYERLLFKAQTGNKWSQYALAKLLLDHESEHFNPDKAVEWLIESAKQNYTVAKYKLGKIFLKGKDVPKDIEYALRWLEEAVEDENSYAEYLLGKTYLKGEDVEQDLLYAEDLLRLSVQHGNKYAKYTLGKALLDGEQITQNISEGLQLLKESAGAGFSAAQYLYGKLLYKGELLPKDIGSAIVYIESAAEQDNPYASYLAGKIRLTEDSVRDVRKAIRHFETAAESGNHYAEYQLGKIYLYGKDVPRDYDKAMEYLRASAEHGNQYAEQLIHSIESNRHWSAAMGSIKLLHYLSRLLQQQMEERDKAKLGQIDRKLKRKIDEKKEAQGLQQG